MISNAVLARKVRKKLEATDAITRLERALSEEIVQEFRQELCQNPVIRQQIRTRLEGNEGDLKRRVDEEPFNSAVRARAKHRASDRANREKEESRKYRRSKPRRRSAFDKLYKVSRKMADFIGAPEITRRDLTTFMHSYFKVNRLQDPADRRYIISNRVLKDMFKVDRFHSFELMKLVKPYILK